MTTFEDAIAIYYQRLGESHPNTQTIWQAFLPFLHKAVQSGYTLELSDDPMTRIRSVAKLPLLQKMQNEES